MLLASGLALVASMEPARAAFPGGNGKIAFSSHRDGNPEVYAMNANGSGQTNLTNDPAFDERPAFSPDGAKIAFESNRDGNGEVYVMNADGSNPKNVTNSPQSDATATFSPDGTKIAFASERDGGNRQIYVMDIDGSEVSRLTIGSHDNDHPS